MGRLQRDCQNVLSTKCEPCSKGACSDLTLYARAMLVLSRIDIWIPQMQHMHERLGELSTKYEQSVSDAAAATYSYICHKSIATCLLDWLTNTGRKINALQ